MVDINTTINTTIGILEQAAPALTPALKDVHLLMGKIELLVGGVFGLYLISIIIRLFIERKNRRMLNEIKHELAVMNIHISELRKQQKRQQEKQYSRHLNSGQKKRETKQT